MADFRRQMLYISEVGCPSTTHIRAEPSFSQLETPPERLSLPRDDVLVTGSSALAASEMAATIDSCFGCPKPRQTP
jgi:hypothetical protein